MAVATDYAAVVQQLYISYFGRPADYYGLTSFENALLAANAPTDFASLSTLVQAGTNSSLDALVNGFSSSAESTALYGTGTDTISISKFVNAIYNNVLNRDADTAGLTFWVNAIKSGALSQADAAIAITEGALTNTSDQGKIDGAVVANKVTVAGYFTADLTTAAQINGYSGDAAAAAARALLSTVNDTTDLVAVQATVSSTITSIVSGTGTTTALTVGEDDFTGTTANDIYTAATVTTGGSVVDTLTGLDVIDGGAGNNTLKATLVDSENPTLKNIQNVQVRFVGGELDLTNATGVTNVVVANSTSAGAVDAVGAAATLGVSNQTANVTFTGSTAKTLAVALDTVGSSTVTTAVNLTGDAATTVNLTTNNSTASIVAGTAIKTLTVAASGANEITVGSAAITSVTVTGTGSLTLDNALSAITKLDASANSGGVEATVTSAVAVAITGGSGADAITLSAPVTKSSVALGAGDDVLTLTGVVAAASTFDGGAGANTLVIQDTTDLSAYTATTFKTAFTNFQTLELDDTGAGLTVDASVLAGFSSYVADEGAITINHLGAATAITVDGDLTSLTLATDTTVVTDITKAGVTLTLDNGATTATNGVSVASLTTDAATLTIHSAGSISTTGTHNVVTLDGTEANLTKVVIDGSQAVDFTTGALAGHTLTIDASTATGAVSVTATAATEVVNINGGTAADTIVGGTLGGAIYGGLGGDHIDVSAGVGTVDTIVYKAVGESTYSVKADGVTLGAGIDTITGFETGTDKIDLTGLGLSATSVIVDKTAASFNALTTLAATSDFYNDSTGTARSVVEVTVGTDTFLFVDANKDHKFDASTDLVIHLTGSTHVAAGDIIFA